MNGVGLVKRHSFPLQTFTWNGVRRTPVKLNNDELINPYKVKNAPVINSEGTKEEREARLESALLWIRKELVSISTRTKSFVGNLGCEVLMRFKLEKSRNHCTNLITQLP
jgi:hypothetical protein